MLTDGTILLRAPEPSDIDSMFRWENDAQIWTDGSTRAPTSRKMLHDFVNFYNPDPCAAGQLRLVIELIASQTPVGCVDLYDYDAVNRRSGVGIVIDPEHQRRGYGRDAIALLCNYCRDLLGLHQLWAIVNRCNSGSIALFERAGFVTCGSLRSWIRIGDRYSDALMYQRLLV